MWLLGWATLARYVSQLTLNEQSFISEEILPLAK